MNDGKTTQINVRLTADEAARLEEVAKAAGMSKSDFLRAAITSGDVGKVKRPADLQTIDKKTNAIYNRAWMSERKIDRLDFLAKVIVVEVFVGVGVILIFK